MMQRKKLHSLAVFLTTITASIFIPLSVNADDPPATTPTDPYTLGPDCNCNKDTPHQYTSTNNNHPIRVRGGSHYIELNNVTIVSANYPTNSDIDKDVPAIEISKSATPPYSISNVTITLKGENTLKSPDGRAGIQITSGNFLTINGDGNLTTEGGKSGAGIGNAGESDSSGEITIETDSTNSTKDAPKGTIIATGGTGAAGIGGGEGGGCGKITINSGIVRATGGTGYKFTDQTTGKTTTTKGGAGIGTGGKGKGGGEVVLAGGDVYVTGGMGGVDNPDIPQREGIDCTTLSSNNGSANLYSNSPISKSTNTDNFNGIVWTQDKSGTDYAMGMVYGKAVLNKPLDHKSLTIQDGCSVIIPSNITIPLTNGSITGNKTTTIINADKLKPSAPYHVDDNIRKCVTLAPDHITITEPNLVYNGEPRDDEAYNVATEWKDPYITDAPTYDVDDAGWTKTYTVGSSNPEHIQDAATYTVTYSNPSFTDITFEVTIDHADLKDTTVEFVDKDTGEFVKSVPYTGKPCTPVPVVKLGDYTLTEDTGKGGDYRAIKPEHYEHNDTISKGEDVASVAITHTANGNFIGETRGTFRIDPASLANATITIDPQSTIYNGKKQGPKTITVTLPGEDPDNPIKLKEGTDFEVVTSAEPKNAGTIEYTIKGIEGGNYTGTSSSSAKYEIEKKPISVVSSSSATIENKVYDGTNKFELSGVKLSGVEGDDKVEIVSGSVSGSDVGSYSEITFDASDLAGDSSSNYTLEEGGKITLSTPVEITPRTPKDAAPNNRQHTVSTTNNQRFACVIEIDKEDGVDLEEYQFQMDDGAPVPGSLDPNNPNKVICSFDGIEPESTHTFHVSTKGASKNIVAKEIGSKQVTFEKLKNPKEDVPGFELSINEGNADKKTYTITMPKSDDPDVEYRIIAVGSEEDTPYDSIKTDKTDCKPGTKYIGQMRYKETAVYKASEPVSSPELTTPKSPLADSGPKYKTKWKRIIPNQSDSIELPDALKDAEYASMQEVTTDLTRHLSGLGAYQDQEHTAFYDVTIQVITRNDAGEPETRDAQPGDFEDGGIPVTLPAKSLPQGVVATENQFSAAHMFASNDFAEYSAGEIETCLSSEGSEVFQGSGKGVTFVVNGTSPVGIAWSTAPEEPTDPEDPNNPNNPEDPNNPDNNDPNNPDNNDPNNPNGTDPNNPDGNNGDANAADPNANNAADPNAANADGTDANGEDAKSAAQSAVDALKSAAASLLPKTGDTSKIIMWVVAAVAACIAVIAVLRSKAKKGKKAKSSSSAKTSATAKKPAATTAKKPSSTTAKKTTAKKPASGTAKKTTTTKKGH